jgi:branched-chain amino acid transport system substrate-binding protein
MDKSLHYPRILLRRTHLKKRLLIILIGICLVALLATPLATVGCGGEEETTTVKTTTTTPAPTTTAGPTPPAQDKIVIGASRPVTGFLKDIGDYALGPILNMWVAEVNKKGGIEVAGKMLPVELIIRDDGSDMGTMVDNLEKLILEDQVDFIMPPCSTAFLYAAAPLANEYGYIFMGAEGGATTLTDMLPELPYVFASLNYSDYYQVPVLVDLFEEWGVETVAMIYIADLHGIEYSHIALSEFTKRGIEVVYSEGVLPTATDLTPMLKQARDSGADAFCSFTYPPVSINVYAQAMELNYNPDVFVIGPGANFQFYYDIFGPMTEGLVGFGAWNRKSSPALNELADLLVEYTGEAGLAAFGDEEAFIDWWGAPFYWGMLQFFEQAITKAGTLDQDVIRDVMATSTFETCLGTTWWDIHGENGGGLLALECHPGEVGQWQNGIYEVIGPSDKATADAIYPKPTFPTE